jgi:N-acetylmuramoyl-L-alanine amidase
LKKSLFIFLLAVSSWGYAHADVDTRPQVVIDPGHGGSDTGSKDGSEVEKEWNLKIAQALNKVFEANGYQVLMTRTSDEDLDAEKRINAINTSNAKVVLSIHVDREWTGTQTGPFLVVEPPNQPATADVDSIQPLGAITPISYHASLKLARNIAQKLGANISMSDLSDSRGLAGEVVSPNGKIACLPHQSLRYISKPAVIITPLFITSVSDLKKFGESTAVDDFALKVVMGVSDYLGIVLKLPTPTVVVAK